MERPDLGRDRVFVAQRQDVVFESFADETVAVHLGTGRYFSIDLTGAEVIELLNSGSALGAVVDHLSARYDQDPQFVDDVVTEFVGRLVEEGLLRPSPEDQARAPLPEPSAATRVFTVPTLTVYSDMEDLLLLDPVHDVDETGWPVRVEPAVSDTSAPVDSE